MGTLLSLLIQLTYIFYQPMFIQNTPRKVYIFASEKHATLRQQQAKLLYEDSSELNERDIQITMVSKESSLWREYHILPATFAVILIGKDGGEKFRSYQLVQPATLYGLIDAMPMRRNEIRKKKKTD